MRLFVFKFFCLIALIVSSYAGVLIVVNANDSNRFLAAAIDKHALLKQMPSPKIVIIGGSNVALSIDGALLEHELGLPTVNMGLHGGLGLRYMLNEVKPYLGKGDVIVIVPEYQQFLGLLDGDETLIDLLFLFPEGITYLDYPDQYFTLLSKFRSASASQVKGYLEQLREGKRPIYNRSGFDQNGDMIAHLGQTSDADFATVPLLNEKQSVFDDATVRALAKFGADAQSVGAQAVLTFPSIPEWQYHNSQKQIQLIYTRLQSNPPIPILNAPADCVMPLDYFYDTAYHLNARGREIRTRQLIGDLQFHGVTKKLTGN